MNARVLCFPAAVACIAALDGCQGTRPTDPSIRRCHDDSLTTVDTLPTGEVLTVLVIYQDDRKRCRIARRTVRSDAQVQVA